MSDAALKYEPLTKVESEARWNEWLASVESDWSEIEASTARTLSRIVSAVQPRDEVVFVAFSHGRAQGFGTSPAAAVDDSRRRMLDRLKSNPKAFGEVPPAGGLSELVHWELGGLSVTKFLGPEVRELAERLVRLV